MPRLPTLSGVEIVRRFERLGWVISRQKGSHIILTKEGAIATLSVPNHKAVDRGTLRGLIRSAGLSVEQFSNAG